MTEKVVAMSFGLALAEPSDIPIPYQEIGRGSERPAFLWKGGPFRAWHNGRIVTHCALVWLYRDQQAPGREHRKAAGPSVW